MLKRVHSGRGWAPEVTFGLHPAEELHHCHHPDGAHAIRACWLEPCIGARGVGASIKEGPKQPTWRRWQMRCSQCHLQRASSSDHDNKTVFQAGWKTSACDSFRKNPCCIFDHVNTMGAPGTLTREHSRGLPRLRRVVVVGNLGLLKRISGFQGRAPTRSSALCVQAPTHHGHGPRRITPKNVHCCPRNARRSPGSRACPIMKWRAGGAVTIVGTYHFISARDSWWARSPPSRQAFSLSLSVQTCLVVPEYVHVLVTVRRGLGERTNTIDDLVILPVNLVMEWSLWFRHLRSAVFCSTQFSNVELDVFSRMCLLAILLWCCFMPCNFVDAREGVSTHSRCEKNGLCPSRAQQGLPAYLIRAEFFVPPLASHLCHFTPDFSLQKEGVSHGIQVPCSTGLLLATDLNDVEETSHAIAISLAIELSLLPETLRAASSQNTTQIQCAWKQDRCRKKERHSAGQPSNISYNLWLPHSLCTSLSSCSVVSVPCSYGRGPGRIPDLELPFTASSLNLFLRSGPSRINERRRRWRWQSGRGPPVKRSWR